MALVFMDGFDHYATADITKKWTSVDTSPAIGASSGRRSGGALLAPNAVTNGAQVLKTLPAAYATLIVGFAWKISGMSGRSVVRFLDTAVEHISVELAVDGTLVVQRAGSATLAISSNSISLNTWYYLEFKATIHDSTGAFELRLNGDVWASGSNVDTRNAGNASVNRLALGADGNMSVSATQYFDDFYVADTSGSAPQNDFLGDVRIDTVYPSADGNYTQFTPSTGTDHYALVDETTPSTSDYNESGTAGHKDSYTMQDVSSIPGTIFGVQVNAYAHKDDAGLRSLKIGVRSGTTDSVDAGSALSESALYYRHILETDPATAAAWTESGVNAAEALVEVV